MRLRRAWVCSSIVLAVWPFARRRRCSTPGTEGACYRAGYAVECALKACIAKQTREHDFPDRRRVLDSYTHDVKQLVRTANLDDALQRRLGDATFELNGQVVCDGSVERRYVTSATAKEAVDLIAAINGENIGILT